jgi:hypothetical protein
MEQSVAASMRSGGRIETEVLWHLDEEGSGPVIRIVLAERASVIYLRNAFERVAELGFPIEVGEQRDMRLSGLSSVILRRTEQAAPKSLSGRDRAFVWACTREQWLTHAAMLEPFRRGQPGHQYLTDEGIDDALVEVSYGEAPLPLDPKRIN